MYKLAGAQLSKDLKKISLGVRPLLKSAIKDPLRFGKVVDQMIDGAGPKEESLKLERARSAQQEYILDQVNFLKAAWAHDLENPDSQLRAANPFAQEGAVKDGEEDDESDAVDEDSDSEASSDGPKKGSEDSSDEDSNEDSNDDSDKDSDDEAEDSDDGKDDEEPSLFVST
jgi:hypothetical protein